MPALLGLDKLQDNCSYHNHFAVEKTGIERLRTCPSRWRICNSSPRILNLETLLLTSMYCIYNSSSSFLHVIWI